MQISTKTCSKILITAFLSLNSISCSRLSLAVRWADTVIVEAVDSRFDLSSEQKKEFRVEVENSLSQIKKEKFPLWADRLDAWANSIEKEKISEATSKNMWNYLQAEFRDLAKYAEPPMMKLIDQINDANFEANKSNALEELVKNRKKLNSSDQIAADTKKKFMAWIEFWHDSPTEEQEKKLNEFLKQHPFPAEASWSHREAQLIKFYDLKKDRAALKSWVKDSLYNPEKLRPVEYQNAILEWQKNLQGFILEFHQSLSVDQLKYVQVQLRKRAKELRELAAKSN